MSLEIILVGIVVGIANFASRFGPFFVIQKFQQRSQQRGALSRYAVPADHDGAQHHGRDLRRRPGAARSCACHRLRLAPHPRRSGQTAWFWG